MKSRSLGCSARLRAALCLLPALLFPALAHGDAGDVLINEVDSDTPASDVLEFVELYDGGTGNTPLDGLVLVFYNGSTDLSYGAFDLDGFATNAAGFFVVGNPMVANVGLSFDPGGSGFLQNGPDAVALYLGNAADFPNGTPVTTSGLLDAVVYDTNDPDDSGLLLGLAPMDIVLAQINEGETNSSVQSMSRVPDGGTAFDSAAFVVGDPSPGVSNVLVLEVTLFPSPLTLMESGGVTVSEVMVVLDAAPEADLTLTIANPDPTELAMPASLVIPAGMTTGSFTATAVDDAWPDGDQAVQVVVSALGYFDGIATITVQDDGDSDPGLVLNEIYAAVDSGGGDANQDGLVGDADGSDEFVELVNNTATDLDLSGFTLSDAATVRHTFPAGTVLEPGCALVVFGGGNVLEGRLAAFGGAVVQKANGSNTFGLSLNNGGDLVSIRNAPADGGLEVAGHAFGLSGTTFGNNTSSLGSFSRSPDLVGDFQLGPYSAGYQADGFTPFCPLPNAIGADLSANPVAENAGSVTLELSVAVAPVSDLTIQLSASNNPNAVAIPATATIAGGTSATSVTVTLIDNVFQNAPRAVTLIASAPGFVSGSTVLTIDDDGDPAVNLFINEFDSDQPGDEDFEFIEIYDGGLGNVPLDGLIVVLFNGANDQSYDTISLDGQVTDPSGYFVLGDAAVPNVGLVVASFTLQNGPDGIALYRDSALNFPDNSPPTANNLVDAVVYDTGSMLADGLLSVLTPGSNAVNEGSDNNITAAARVPNGGTPLDSSNFAAQTPTPGTTNVLSGNGYTLWAGGFEGIGGPDVDEEFDGLPNLLEYVFDKDPFVSDPSPALIPVINGDGRPQVSIAKGAAAGADPLLDLRVEASTGLADGTWSTGDTRIVTNSPSALVVEYTGSATTVFLRIVATYP